MNRCANCAFWTPNTDRNDFHDAVHYYDSDDYEAARSKTDEADRLFGICQKINLRAGQDLALDAPPPLAVAKDGSDYMADLYTRAEFGCVLHEPAQSSRGSISKNSNFTA